MRINLPVTNTEYPIEENTLILSTTDTKGRITYINPTFIEVSGFTAAVRNKLAKFKSAKTSILLIIPLPAFLSFEHIRM